MNASHFVQVVVAGHHFAFKMIGQQHHLHVDGLPRHLRKFTLVNGEVDVRFVSEFIQHIEPTSPSCAPHFIRTVGDGLKFGQNAPRHNQLCIENSRIHHVSDSAINDDARVENQWPNTFDLFGELDIWNNESKIVLRLNEHRDTDVTDSNRDQQLDVRHRR